MNYKLIGLNTLTEYAEQNKEYTLGEILFSFLRPSISGIEDIKDIKNISDEDLYTIIEKAKDIEKETHYYEGK